MKTLTPAYGRDYNSKAEAIKDLEEGKDFKCTEIIEGVVDQLCSIRDLKPGEEVCLRYKKLSMIALWTNPCLTT